MNIVLRLYRCGRRWKLGRFRADRCIWHIAHHEFQRASICYLSVSKPYLIQRATIEPDTLHILVVVGIVVSEDNEIFAIFQMNRRLVEDGTANVINRNAWRDGIKAEHRENY